MIISYIQLIYLSVGGFVFLLSIIVFLRNIFLKIKNKKYKTLTDFKEDLTNNMVKLAKQAENIYSNIQGLGKNKSILKADYVINHLQNMALSNNQEFDVDEWYKKLNDFIQSTKEINYTNEPIKSNLDQNVDCNISNIDNVVDSENNKIM